MDSCKEWESCTLQLVITTLASLDSIRKMGEEHTTGLENSQIYMKESSKVEKGMGEVLSGGVTEVGMKGSSVRVCRVERAVFIEMGAPSNTMESGIMACLMEKALNFLKMDSVSREISKRTNSTVMVSFTKTIRLFTEFGRIMNSL